MDEYKKCRGPDELVNFTDSDLAGDIDNRKSTAGMHSISTEI